MSQAEKILFRKFPFSPKRKVTTALSGSFQSRLKGHGQEFSGLRPYEFGDDSRKIHWKHYAKTGEMAVREEISERNMRVWIVQDLSRSMEFGAKPYLINGFFLFAGHLAREGSSSVGLVGFSDKVHIFRKPKTGLFRRPALQTPPGEAVLSCALRPLSRYARAGDIVFLVSDFFSEEGLESELKPFALNQELIPVVVRDPREKMRTGHARISSRDMETHRNLNTLRSANLEAYDAKLRELFNRLTIDFLWIEGKNRDDAIKSILEWLYRRNR